MAPPGSVADRYAGIRIADYSNIRTSRRALPASVNSTRVSSAAARAYKYNPRGPRVILRLDTDSEDEESDEEEGIAL